MKSFVRLLIPVFAMTVFGYCIYLFVSFVGADVTMNYNYFAILTCTVLACIINYRLSLREQTIVKIAIVNAALVVLTEIVGFSTYNEIEGVILHFAAAIVFIIPVAGSLVLCRHPIRANMMLLFCEFSVVGTVCLMAMQLGLLQIPQMALILSVICLALNLYLLSSLRTAAPTERKVEVKKQIEKGMIIIVIIICAVFATIAVVVFALPAVRGALLDGFAAIGRFFIALGKAIESFFAWLAEQLPDSAPLELEAMPAAEASMPEGGELEYMTQIPDLVKIIVIAVVTVLIISVVIVAIIKKRKQKLRSIMGAVQVIRDDIDDRDGLISLIVSLLRRFVDNLVMLYRLAKKRNTYEGLFVRLSRIAKRRGFARVPSETAAEYLMRLMPELVRIHAEEDKSSWVNDFMAEFAQRMDVILYAPVCSQQCSIDIDKTSRVLRLAKRIKKS